MSRGYALVAVCRLLVAVSGFSFCRAWALERSGFSSCGTRAHRLSCPEVCGIFPPRPRIEHVSPALTGGFLTTRPPGKSKDALLLISPSLASPSHQGTTEAFLFFHSKTFPLLCLPRTLCQNVSDCYFKKQVLNKLPLHVLIRLVLLFPTIPNLNH